MADALRAGKNPDSVGVHERHSMVLRVLFNHSPGDPPNSLRVLLCHRTPTLHRASGLRGDLMAVPAQRPFVHIRQSRALAS